MMTSKVFDVAQDAGFDHVKRENRDSRDERTRIEETATSRGLSVCGDGKYILVRRVSA